MGTIVTKLEIRGVDGNFIQAGETEDREYIQVVITEINAEKQRMIAATILLNKQQWRALCETQYRLHVKDIHSEESEDA